MIQLIVAFLPRISENDPPNIAQTLMKKIMDRTEKDLAKLEKPKN